MLTLKEKNYTILTMVKNIGKKKATRAIGAFLVAAIFAISGFVGGAFAPIARYLSDAFTNSALDQTTQPFTGEFANGRISGLPRESVRVGTTLAKPKYEEGTSDEGVAVLWRITTPRAVKISDATITGSGAGQWSNKYAQSGSFEWRFYVKATNNTTFAANVKAEDASVYSYPFTVFQDTYSFAAPTSAQNKYDKDENGKQLTSWIPNVINAGASVLLPLPNKFVDQAGNDLFDDETEDVEGLRKQVVDSWTEGKRSAFYTTTKDTEEFKKLIWSNMEISYPGATVKGTQNAGGWIFGEGSIVARTLTATSAGAYYAQYTLNHPKIKATMDTAKISAETFDPKQVIFQSMQSNFSVSLTGNEMTYNREFDIPLPTMKTASLTDLGLTTEELRSRVGFGTPVRFSNETSATNYTYIEVEHFYLQGPMYKADGSARYFGDDEGNPESPKHIDENDNYKFTAKGPGKYVFNYYTTTLFGTGELGYANDKPNTDESGKYLVGVWQQMMFVNRNNEIPELKWTVPFKYYDKNAQGNYVELTTQDAIKNASDLAIARPVSGSSLFQIKGEDLKTSDILEQYGEDKYFANAPDLRAYMPETFSGKTQVLDGEKLILPALLGKSNLSSGAKLTYRITLSRGVGSNAEHIYFNSDLPTDDKENTFHYEHNKPLEINFGAFGSGYLASWAADSTKNTYTLSVSCDDDNVAREKFVGVSGAGRPSTTSTYVFSVEESIADMQIDPTFNDTSIQLNSASYYADDTISFRVANINDETTTNVPVDYYLVYGSEKIKLLPSDIKNGVATFELNVERNKRAGDLLDALDEETTGMLPVKVIAVAKNYWALTNQVKPDFTPNNVLNIDTVISGTYTEDEHDGIAILTTNIKLFDMTKSGASATITADGTFTAGEINKTCEIPDIKIEYNDSEDGGKSIETTIIISLISPSGAATLAGLSGGGFHSAFIIGGTYDEDAKIGHLLSDLSFKPRTRGAHQLVVTVFNAGNNVSVMRAQINVTGRAIIVPGLNAASVSGDDNIGTTTLRVGQSGKLPEVRALINGIEFITDGKNGIIPKDDTRTTDNGKSVGTYTIVGEFNGANVFGKIGNQFIPMSPGSFTFTYEMEFDATELKTVIPDIDDTQEYKQSVSHRINVVDSNSGDLSLAIDAEAYTFKNLVTNGGTYKRIDKDGENVTNADARSGKVDVYNLLTEIATSPNNSEIRVENSTLNAGLEFKKFTALDKEDLYDFAPIFLPNIYDTWANGLARVNGFNLTEAYQITVTHSGLTNPTIFDSKKVDAVRDSEREKNIARIGNDTTGAKDFYYFQPSGEVKVAKPEQKPSTLKPTVAGGAKINTPYDKDGNVLKAIPTDADKKVYFCKKVDADASKSEWVYLDYATQVKPEYLNNSSLYDTRTAPDGEYTITYTLAYGNLTSEKKFTVRIGDTAVPTIKFRESHEDELFGRTYNKGDQFRFHTNWFQVEANTGTMTARTFGTTEYADWYVAKNMTVSVSRPGSSPYPNNEIFREPRESENTKFVEWKLFDGTSNPDGKDRIDAAGYVYRVDGTGSDAKYVEHLKTLTSGTATDREYWFDLEESGDYTITFRIESKSGIGTTITKTISVTTPEPAKKISAQTIWGIMLIIISSGLLLGVIFYFFQTGRKTKFLGGATSKAITSKPVSPAEKDVDKTSFKDKIATKKAEKTLENDVNTPEKGE